MDGETSLLNAFCGSDDLVKGAASANRIIHFCLPLDANLKAEGYPHRCAECFEYLFCDE